MKFRLFLFISVNLLLALAVLFYKLAVTEPTIEGMSESKAQYLTADRREVTGIHLRQQNNQEFGETQLKGRWSLIYFGYTQCPDVCPLTLGILSQFLKKLETADPTLAAQTQGIFISVDPARDTVERLRDYVAYFHHSMLGVTGAPEELKGLITQFQSTYDYGEKDAAGGYLVHHPTSLFLVDPQGRYVGRFTKPVAIGDLWDAYEAHRKSL